MNPSGSGSHSIILTRISEGEIFPHFIREHFGCHFPPISPDVVFVEPAVDGGQIPCGGGWSWEKAPGATPSTMSPWAEHLSFGSSLPHFKLQEFLTLLPCLPSKKSNFSYSLLQSQWWQLHPSSCSSLNSPCAITSSFPHTSDPQFIRTSSRFHLRTHPTWNHFSPPPLPASSP